MKAHHEAGDTTNAENTTNIVDTLNDMGCCVFCCKTRWIVITKDTKEQADEVPNANKDAVITPVAGFGDKLRV